MDSLTAIPASAIAAAAGGKTVAQQVAANPPAPKPNQNPNDPVTAVPSTTPTVVTDSNIRESTIPDTTQRATAALATKGGVIQGAAPAGSLQSANGNYVDQAGNQYMSAPAAVGTTGNAPAALPAAPSTAGTAPATPSSTTDASADTSAPANDYDAFLKSIFDDNPSSATSGAAPANDPYMTLLSTMKATSDAATQTLIGATQQQFASRAAQLAATNTAEHAGLMQALISSGNARYAPILAGQTMTADETAHVLALSDIDAQESSAVAQLQKAQADQDYQTMGKALDHLDSLKTDKINVATKLSDDAAAATKAINDAKAAVATQVSTIAQDLAKNGAPAAVVAAASAATTAADAITAGQGYFQDPTSPAGQYQAYVKDAQSKGLTPMTAGDFLAKQASSDAYSKAYATAKGTADASGLPDDSTDLTPDPTATGVTAAAGISLQAFNYLTQGTASMSRMPAAQRNAIMAEANDWLNKNGIDISTFQSQYNAANDVVQSNIVRENQAKIYANEASGTVDGLISDIQADHAGGLGAGVTGVTGMSSLRAGDVLGIMAGNAVNSPFATKYSTQIRLLANDLAGYLTASAGGTGSAGPSDSDKKEAATIIANGMNAGSLQAFKDTINNNSEKTVGVVQKATDDSQKQIWDLFGVGAQYKPAAAQVNPKDAVDTYVKSNPDQADTVAKLYELPGWTDQDVLDYINQLNTK